MLRSTHSFWLHTLKEQRSEVRSSSVHAHARAYLPVAALGPDVHLAVVLGVVVVEGGLARAESDHAAVVWVALPAVAEKLSTHHVSARGGRSARAYVSTWGVLTRGQLTAAGRGCTGYRLAACRTRSRFLWCSGRSSTVQPQ